MQTIRKTKYPVKSIRSIVCVFGAILLLGVQAGAETQLNIDGDTSEWASLPNLPLEYDSASYADSLGSIEQTKINQDSDFIYVFLQFGEPRPSGAGLGSATPSDRPQANQWDDYSYVELDTEGDGLWDYRTRLVRGKRPGLNNLAVLRRLGTGAEGKMILFPEGDKRYAPLGPRAYLTPNHDGLELRIPRAPLGLSSGTVYLRFLVRYRDAGAPDWDTRYLPADDGWIGVRLYVPGLEGEEARSQARQKEPIVPRSELEEIVTSRYSRGTEDFVVPMVMPESIFARKSPKTEIANPSQGRKVRPVLMIDSRGAVLGDVPLPQPRTQETESDQPQSVVGPE